MEFELERLDRAAAVAGQLLASAPDHATRPAGIELAWAADRLGNGEEVRKWLGGIAYASRWTDAGLAILDGEFVRAAQLFVEIGSLPDEAIARVAAAEKLATAGRRAEADAQLRRALAFWRSVGATRYARQAETRLVASA